MKKESGEQQGDIKYPIEWTTLGEIDHPGEARSRAIVASFIGATTVRVHEVGYANRAPTPEELARMKQLVRQAMQEGALGVGSLLIYAPGVLCAKTDRVVQSPPSTTACIYLAHPQRGQPFARSRRRTHHHRARGENPG